MPANVVRCRECQEILNMSLRAPAVVTPPDYKPLPELTACPKAKILGMYLACPVCDRKLRISNQFREKQVRCNFCSAAFLLDLNQSVVEIEAYYANCPHCKKELKASEKYLGQKVACKFCSKPLQFETA
jgi:hypothetical protein